MDQLLQDLRLTFRSLRRQGGFTAIVVLTLALGIGVNTAVFTGVHAMLLSPLPHLDLDGLTALAMRHATLSVEAYDFSFPDVEDFAAQCMHALSARPSPPSTGVAWCWPTTKARSSSRAKP